MHIAIETRNLSRLYQTYKKPEGVWNSLRGFFNRQYENKIALAPTSIKIEKGQIIGLVGANGAGKTTLLKLLCGLIHPSEGSAQVLGFTPWERRYEFLRRMSILLGQKNQLWWDIPAADSFDLLARIYDLDSKVARHRVAELAEILKCTDLLHIQLRRLSLGERMKMEIIGSLLHRPEVLFLDEPTIGLDIVAQNTIRTFISDYVQQFSPTIILTSHYMDDISTLADRLLLISRGHIVYDGSIQNFMHHSEPTQKLTLKLVTPLNEKLKFWDDLELEAGTEVIHIELLSSRIGYFLEQILKHAQIQNLRLEETNFEEVIHRFLEKDSRHQSTGHSFSI